MVAAMVVTCVFNLPVDVLSWARESPGKMPGGPTDKMPGLGLPVDDLDATKVPVALKGAVFHIRGIVDLKNYLARRQREVDRALDQFLPKASTKPVTIHKAMRYSLFAGGKRLRPILCLAAAEACAGLTKSALPLACAVECIHTYSLIHDDLPSMDNDDFRRGRPTCHKVFGEGIAVLAGDALLTIAFEIASQAKTTARHDMRAILREIAVAAGSRKLIAGQVADLEGEGKAISRAQLRYIHENKTAALLTTSVRLGAMSANATPAQLRALSDFGFALGLAFQVIDDILDVTQTSEKLGKSAGKDVAAHKATYPSVLGLEKSRAEAGRLTRQAHDALRPLGKRAQTLHVLANYLLEREY
jgi:geranylgeranyl diphosphate synthase type II